MITSPYGDGSVAYEEEGRRSIPENLKAPYGFLQRVNLLIVFRQRRRLQKERNAYMLLPNASFAFATIPVPDVGPFKMRSCLRRSLRYLRIFVGATVCPWY